MGDAVLFSPSLAVKINAGYLCTKSDVRRVGAPRAKSAPRTALSRGPGLMETQGSVESRVPLNWTYGTAHTVSIPWCRTIRVHRSFGPCRSSFETLLGK
jgi:hypothetical protein